MYVEASASLFFLLRSSVQKCVLSPSRVSSGDRCYCLFDLMSLIPRRDLKEGRSIAAESKKKKRNTAARPPMTVDKQGARGKEENSGYIEG